MSEAKTSLDEMLAAIRRTGSTHEVVKILQSLASLEATVEPAEFESASAVRLEAFETLRTAMRQDTSNVIAVITELLVPLVIRKKGGEHRQWRHRLQVLLADWINDYMEPDRSVIRDVVLDELLAHLTSSEPEPVISTVAQIGYRRADVVDALFALENSDPSTPGDAALAVLSSLGIPAHGVRQIRELVHARAAARYTDHLWSALYRVADRSSIAVMEEYWLSLPDPGAGPFGITSSVLRIIAQIATREPESGQQELWERALSYTLKSQGAARIFMVGSDLAPRFDTPDVVRTLVGNAFGIEAISDHQRYLLSLRASECVRPEQVQGWSFTQLDEHGLERLHRTAIRNSEMPGHTLTFEARHKEEAWRIATLCLGLTESQDWLQEALEAERNSFVQQRILDVAAHTRMANLPNVVVRWLREPYNETRQQREPGWAPRLAAVRLALSAATREAFDALRHPGFSIDGNLPVATADALAEVARILVTTEPDIVGELLENIKPERNSLERIGAIHALASLAGAGMLSPDASPRIEEFLFRETDPIQKAAAIRTLVAISEDLDDVLVSELATWAISDDGALGQQSALTLAASDRLLEMDEVLTSLGLTQSHRGLEYTANGKRNHWLPQILAWLYRKHPDVALPAVTAMILDRDWIIASQMLQFLLSHKLVIAPSPEIVAALDQRIIDHVSESSAELELFDHAAALSPELLLQRKWSVLLHLWMPAARVAYGNAVARLELDEAARTRQVQALVRLAHDAHYAVRRAAYRGLASVSPAALHQLCRDWAYQEWEYRRRAAEAYSWLPDSDLALADNLANDPEPLVRQAFSRGEDERSERAWAAYHLQIVIDAASNVDHVYSAFPFGEALKKVGDDSTREILQQRLREQEIAPHVGHWLRGIDAAIKTRWAEVTRKWPDAWSDMSGRIETGSGWLQQGNTRRRVTYEAWFQTTAGPHEVPDWGARIHDPEGANDWEFNSEWDTDDAHLQLEDGRSAAVMIVQWRGAVLTVLGAEGLPGNSVTSAGERLGVDT